MRHKRITSLLLTTTCLLVSPNLWPRIDDVACNKNCCGKSSLSSGQEEGGRQADSQSFVNAECAADVGILLFQAESERKNCHVIRQSHLSTLARIESEINIDLKRGGKGTRTSMNRRIVSLLK